VLSMSVLPFDDDGATLSRCLEHPFLRGGCKEACSLLGHPCMCMGEHHGSFVSCIDGELYMYELSVVSVCI
jgi:hypothetical protein